MTKRNLSLGNFNIYIREYIDVFKIKLSILNVFINANQIRKAQ